MRPRARSAKARVERPCKHAEIRGARRHCQRAVEHRDVRLEPAPTRQQHHRLQHQERAKHGARVSRLERVALAVPHAHRKQIVGVKREGADVRRRDGFVELASRSQEEGRVSRERVLRIGRLRESQRRVFTNALQQAIASLARPNAEAVNVEGSQERLFVQR
jgi:hypothetical protein